MISYVLLTMCYFITNLLIFSDIHIQVTYARFYELGLTRDSRVIPGLTVVSVLSTSNLGLNWD